MPGGFFLILRGFQIRCGRAILTWIRWSHLDLANASSRKQLRNRLAVCSWGLGTPGWNAGRAYTPTRSCSMNSRRFETTTSWSPIAMYEMGSTCSICAQNRS